MSVSMQKNISKKLLNELNLFFSSNKKNLVLLLQTYSGEITKTEKY